MKEMVNISHVIVAQASLNKKALIHVSKMQYIVLLEKQTMSITRHKMPQIQSIDQCLAP